MSLTLDERRLTEKILQFSNSLGKSHITSSLNLSGSFFQEKLLRLWHIIKTVCDRFSLSSQVDRSLENV